MIVKQRAIIFCCLFSLVSCCSLRPEDLCNQNTPSSFDESARSALTKKTLDHMRELDVALSLLAKKAEGNVFTSADSTEFLERIDFLRNMISQVVFCVECPADKKSLQFLCALSTTMLECIEWLSRGDDITRGDAVACSGSSILGSDALSAGLNLEKIKVDSFPDDIHALDQLIDANVQRCGDLTAIIQSLSVGFFTRMYRGATSVVRLIASYTVQSKLFAGVGLTVVGLYLLARAKAKEESEKEKGAFAYGQRNKWNKKEITAENLYKHAPKASWSLQGKVKAWFDANKDAWTAFVEQPGSVTEFNKKGALIGHVLQQKGLESASAHNIVFALPNDSDWFVKISSPINRAHLQGAHQDIPYDFFDPRYKDKLQKAYDPKKAVPTHQTASRSFGALKLQEAIKKYTLDELEAVDCRLWSPRKSCDDTQCVVMEKRLKNIKLLRDYTPQELEALLTEKKIGQLLLAAKHAGLWNLTGDNIAVNQSNNKLVILDTEQPNTTKPSQAFNKDESRYLSNVNSGVQSFYQALPVGSKLRDMVETWARRDLEVMGASNNANDLLPLFEANKKAKQENLKQAQKKD